MLEIITKDKTYYFPQTFSELTLGKFQEAMKIEVDDELDASAKLISVLSDIPIGILEDMEFTEFKKLRNACNFLYENTNESQNPIPVLEIKGIKYKLANEISKMTTAEYIDLDSFIKDSVSVVDNLHLVMGIMYRPIDNKGNIEKYKSDRLEERANLFKEHMTVDYALAALNFSLATAQASLEIIADSLKNKK